MHRISQLKRQSHRKVDRIVPGFLYSFFHCFCCSAISSVWDGLLEWVRWGSGGVISCLFSKIFLSTSEDLELSCQLESLEPGAGPVIVQQSSPLSCWARLRGPLSSWTISTPTTTRVKARGNCLVFLSLLMNPPKKWWKNQRSNQFYSFQATV